MMLSKYKVNNVNVCMITSLMIFTHDLTYVLTFVFIFDASKLVSTFILIFVKTYGFIY